MITVDQVRKIISDSMEDEETPVAILNALRKHNGKRLTKRVIDKIIQDTAIDNIRMYRVASMTYIQWGGYWLPESTSGGSLFVAYALKNVIIDVDYIEQRNLGLFQARRERNEERRKLLRTESESMLQHFSDVVNTWQTAKGAIEKYLEYGHLLNVVCCRLQSEIGWKD